MANPSGIGSDCEHGLCVWGDDGARTTLTCYNCKQNVISQMFPSLNQEGYRPFKDLQMPDDPFDDVMERTHSG